MNGPSLFSAEGLSGVLFLVFLGAAGAGALVAVGSGSLIRSVAGLALSFVGVAGLYWSLNSPFVALMQVLIYVGAVCVTIIFAVMLAETACPGQTVRRGAFPAVLAVLAAAGLLWGLSALGFSTEWTGTPGTAGKGTVDEIGTALLTTYGLSFELISVVLLVAVVGSLALARAGSRIGDVGAARTGAGAGMATEAREDRP